MPSVTVPGLGPTGFDVGAVKEVFGNTNSFLLAQQISDAIQAVADSSNTVNVVEPGIEGEIPDPPSTGPGDINELVISAGGEYTIPAGDESDADYVVVINTTDDVTIHGGPNNTIWGGGGLVSVDGGSMITFAEGDVATATLTVDGGVVAGNNSNDTLSETGVNDTIFAGTGDNVLSAGGIGDLIVGNTGTNTISVSGSANTVMAGAGVAEVTVDGSLAQIFGGSGQMSVTTSGTANSVFGGTGNTTILGGDTNGTYFMGSAGEQEFVNSGGSGVVFAGAGSSTVYGSFGEASGSDQVFGGSGDLQLVTGSSNDTVFAGSGAATLYGSFGGSVGNDIIFGGSGDLLIVTGSSNDTVFGGTSANQAVYGGFDPAAANNGNSAIFSGPHGMVIDTAGSSDTIHAGSGNDTMWIGTGTNAGSDLIYGGTGNLRAQFVGGAGSATVIGGTGNTTMYGAAGSNITFQGTQTGVTMMTFGAPGAAEGAATLNAGGSTTNNVLSAFSGSVSVVGGFGNDQIIAGATDKGTVTGATTMTGGAGSNVFVFQHGSVDGKDIITDFTASSGNAVALVNYDALVGGGPGSAANAALAGATTSGGNTNITLHDGTRITFDNTTVAQLHGHIFST
jgi:Ca2+-binding RTX toxin-like protein